MEHGCDIRLIQEMMGHASIETTQIYTHVSAVHLKAAHGRCHPARIPKQAVCEPVALLKPSVEFIDAKALTGGGYGRGSGLVSVLSKIACAVSRTVLNCLVAFASITCDPNALRAPWRVRRAVGELVELCSRLGLNCQRLSWNGCSSLLMAGSPAYDPMLLYAHLEDHPPAPGASPAVALALLDAASTYGLEPWAIGVYLPESCREHPVLFGAEPFIEAITCGPAWNRQLLLEQTWEQFRSQIRVSYELQLEWELYVPDGESWMPLRADSIPSRGHSVQVVTRLVTRRLDPDFEMAFDPLQLVHSAFLGDWYAIGSLIRGGQELPIFATVVHGSEEIGWKITIGDQTSPFDIFKYSLGLYREWNAIFQKRTFQAEVNRVLEEGVRLCRLHQIEDHPELPGGGLALERLAYQLGEEGGLKHPSASWLGSCRKNRGWSHCLRPLICGDES